MIGLVMCGGKGSRMELTGEKLLLKYKRPIVQHVIIALQESGCFSKIVCATSPNAPKTRQFVSKLGVLTVETKGKGYVNDLNEAITRFDDDVFVTSADLPLLDAEIVKEIVKLRIKGPWISVVARKKFLDLFGAKAEYLVNSGNEEYAYTGISIVSPKEISKMKQVRESYIILDDKRVTINLDTKEDYDLFCAT